MPPNERSRYALVFVSNFVSTKVFRRGQSEPQSIGAAKRRRQRPGCPVHPIACVLPKVQRCAPTTMYVRAPCTIDSHFSLLPDCFKEPFLRLLDVSLLFFSSMTNLYVHRSLDMINHNNFKHMAILRTTYSAHINTHH